jgi:small subunit ribosomal protein S6
MKRYETITIIDPDLSEDGRKPILERIGSLISERKGLDILVDDWGSRRLAYEIKKKSRGYYIRFDYCGDGPLVDEIERFCRIDDRVLKYMTVLTDDKADPEEIQKEIDEAKEKIEAANAAKAAQAESAEKAATAEPKEEVKTAEPASEAPETEPEVTPAEDAGETAKEEPNA